MTRTSIFCVAVLLSAAATHGQSSPWAARAGSSETLSGNASQLQNEYFRVEQWGLLSTRTTLWHAEWLYPTANDRHAAGVFFIDAHKFASGDFDGDGAQDVFLNLVPFPHTLMRPAIAPVLLRNVNGRLQYWPEGWSGAPPERYFSYKATAADFNRDGRDDVVTSSMGIITRNADGSFTSHWEPIATAMSTGDGRLADGSRLIQGQAAGGVIPDFTFAHDLAVGDLNADGFLDIYQGRTLLLGDGRGGFVKRNDLLPLEAKDTRLPPIMSSAIGDLDGDGIGDLVVAYFDGHAPMNGWIFLSDGRGGIAQGRRIPLPVGRYGLGTTKHNEIRIADLDADGWSDIVVGQTRAIPYYSGRALQILMNRGGGNFVDETATRISGDDREGAHGEGPVTLMDTNGDGHVDIVDSAPPPVGFATFVNDGHGRFTRMPRSLLPLVRNRNLTSWENLAPGNEFGDSQASNNKVYPVTLDGNGVSYLVQFDHAPRRWPQLQGDAKEHSYYVIRALKPYGRAATPAGLAPGDNVTGLWWNGAESGWGLSLNQQGSTLFGALFTYAANGSGVWLVMTAGQRQLDGSFSGTLYQTTGPAFNASPFLPLGSGVGSVTAVGKMRVAFANRNRATLTYSYNGVSVTKSVTPQVFSSATTCSPTSASRTNRTNFTDLWWVPGESGWGVNFAHQGETLFGTLFTYAPGTSASNPGMWLVMSAGQRQPDASYRGDLYRVNGPPFNAMPFAPVGAGNATRVGTMQVRFHDGERATLQYDVGGTEVTKQIVPQVFGAERPSCRSAG